MNVRVQGAYLDCLAWTGSVTKLADVNGSNSWFEAPYKAA